MRFPPLPSWARFSSPGQQHPAFAPCSGLIAVVASTTNIVSGFLITDRMLKMFKRGNLAKTK